MEFFEDDMYPVISNLRRSAMKIIYTETPEIDLKNGKHFSLDIASCEWKKVSRPMMSELSVSSKSKQERATKLCVFENELYEKAGLSKFKYTLILGDELEEGDTRTARVGVIKGIFVSENGGGLARPEPIQSTQTRRPLPPAVILDER